VLLNEKERPFSDFFVSHRMSFRSKCFSYGLQYNHPNIIKEVVRMTILHLNCYVDESGQDTKGAFFLVIVVLVERSLASEMESKLIDIEKTTTKNSLKWTKTPFEVRKKFLSEIARMSEF